MGQNDKLEFIIMLLIENRALGDNGDFLCFLKEHYDIKSFNKRYTQLLDEYMNQYALNKTEKSEENL